MRRQRKNGQQHEKLTVVLDARLAWTSALVLAVVVMVGLVRGTQALHERQRSRPPACAYDLPLEYKYLLVGYSCPTPGCDNTLLECHGTAPHQVKHTVMEMVQSAVHPDSIRALLESSCPRIPDDDPLGAFLQQIDALAEDAVDGQAAEPAPGPPPAEGEGGP
ncbi:MAG: hypothetical protein ACE5G2_08515 [Candidatus Krumholzibacteriia bacterium]